MEPARGPHLLPGHVGGANFCACALYHADLLKCWVDHFSSLGQSECSSNEFLRKSQHLVGELASESLGSCDNILDSEIDEEEVEFAIRRLRRNRAGGADNVSPEHLKFSGPVFRKWLCHI